MKLSKPQDNQQGLMVEQFGYCCGSTKLFDNLNFTVPRGQLLQIVGDNGVGKSTLLRLLVGLLPLQTGRLRWQGLPLDVSALVASRQLFYLDHRIAVKSQLSLVENLRFDYHLLNLNHQQIDAALQRFGLLAMRQQLAGVLSRGQRQRLALCKLLLSPAVLLVLDEPLTALDSTSTQVFFEVLRHKLESGASVVVTTHRPLALANRTLVLKNQEIAHVA